MPCPVRGSPAVSFFPDWRAFLPFCRCSFLCTDFVLLRLGCRLLDWLLHAVGVHRLDSRRDVNVDVDSRRREISLGNRPVDCTIDTSPVEVVDGSSICVSGFPAGVHLYGSLVGAMTSLCRPRVVPLCAAGTFGRPTSLVRGMQPPFSKDYIQLLKATFRGRSYYGGPDLCCRKCGAFFYPEIVAALINMPNTHHRLVDTFRIAR
ncbi:uncharacterized protein LOC125511167 [Triticum urartu]|uniref:uncharacterized protein LOC125511167 n=1 Tax=Triticum urartu TaxID=4572 RepID=UPI00204316E5|nr:uncharacterized protein LOC125511167 [Triticum urartu]